MWTTFLVEGVVKARLGAAVELTVNQLRYYYYVSKLLQVVPTIEQRSKIQHCYVATDTPQTIQELQDELETVGRPNGISCTVHHLPKAIGYESDRSTHDTFHFLSEIKLLIDSTYFIGTYSSNVGYVTSLYRGCERRSEGELDITHIASKLNHYYHSYGVDQDEWSFI